MPPSDVQQAQEDTTARSYSLAFVMIAAAFVACLILSNIIAVKLIVVFGMILPAAVIIFPISYIIGDVLTEVYGYRKTRTVIWLGFALNLFAVLAIWTGGLLPAAPVWDGQSAYTKILGATPRLLAASGIAYLVGEFSNSIIMAKMKVATRGKWLWSRTIGSSIVGQGLDSAVFITIAFAGLLPMPVLAQVIASQWLIKTGYEVLATPLTYLVVNFLKRREQLDVFDTDITFNPLAHHRHER